MPPRAKILNNGMYVKVYLNKLTKMKNVEPLTKRSIQLLRMIYEKGVSTNTYMLRVKQDELSKILGVSRQALNVHLRKLKSAGYIRTGRGFLDVTDEGLNALGVSTIPAFILIKVSPVKRIQVYERIRDLSVARAFRIAGDVDALIMVERENMDEILKKLYAIDGIQDTRSYVTIETIK
jgi:DNA-binding Lrp family transcriptional regulator